MDLRIVTEPQQGATYDDLLRVARAAEDFGFDGFFRSDHFLRNAGPGDPGPGSTDAWTTLAGLARETSRIRLGTLVTPVTFRLPGPLAIAVAQVDAMSGGRIELGLGAGWNAEEHTAYGVPFPENRFDLLEEQLRIITGLWGTPVGETFDFTGRHYTLSDSPALPKPAQRPGPPIILGGSGPRRLPRLAAAYASEFNSRFMPPEDAAENYGRVREACRAVGRDPGDLAYSITLVTVCGRTDTEIALRTARVAEIAPPNQRVIPTTPEQLVDLLGRYREAGAGRVYLRTFDIADLAQLELVASEVLPRVS
jgi:F420-dependent oxidoreductase-like protein